MSIKYIKENSLPPKLQCYWLDASLRIEHLENVINKFESINMEAYSSPIEKIKSSILSGKELTQKMFNVCMNTHVWLKNENECTCEDKKITQMRHESGCLADVNMCSCVNPNEKKMYQEIDEELKDFEEYFIGIISTTNIGFKKNH